MPDNEAKPTASTVDEDPAVRIPLPSLLRSVDPTMPRVADIRLIEGGGRANRHRDAGLSPTRTVVPLLTSCLLSGCSAAGAPSFELFGAFFPAWLFCGVLGVVGAGAARGLFVMSGLSDRLPYQLFVCTAIGVLVACLAWLLAFGW